MAVLMGTACDPPGKPGAPETAPEYVTTFEVLYRNHCSGCHGPNGKNGAARILNDPLYLALIPKDTFRNVVIYGRPGTNMPAWAVEQGGPLYPKQINALVDGVYKTWAKPEQFHAQQLPSYSGQGFTGNADNGRKLFVRDCFACHGKGAPIGSVTDMQYVALVSNQMLRTSILVGRPDFGMPDYRFLNLGHALSNQDVADLVAFISSKRPAYAEQEIKVEQTGSGQSGAITAGNQGSGFGPGSATQQPKEINKTGGSIRGGPK
jgi:cytochrome c oxidase cbb3-type subunit 3/ubiquinol-cytochrome c reductase cytochrome c subunit